MGKDCEREPKISLHISSEKDGTRPRKVSKLCSLLSTSLGETVIPALLEVSSVLRTAWCEYEQKLTLSPYLLCKLHLRFLSSF